MLKTIKKLIHAAYLILRGYDPIYFVGKDGYISTGSGMWFASGTKAFGKPGEAIGHLKEKSRSAGVIWKKVEYRGAVFYVSNTMQIRDQYVGVLEPEFDGKRYYVNARIRGKNGGWHKTSIHRSCLVAMAFLGHKKHSDLQIHHKNGNRCDDRPENLQILSPAAHKALHAEEQGKGTTEKKKTRRGKRGGKRAKKAEAAKLCREAEALEHAGNAESAPEPQQETQPKAKREKPLPKKMPLSKMSVVRNASFEVSMPAGTPFRSCVVKTLRTIEEYDLVEGGIDSAVRPLRQSFQRLCESDADDVTMFDEMLFALRSVSLFVEQYPHLNSSTLKDLTRAFYGKLKKAVNAIKQGDPVEAVVLLEMLEEERRNPHYAAIGYVNRFNGLYVEMKKALDAKQGEAS